MRSLTQKINDHVVRIYERRRHRAYVLRDQAVRSLYRQYPELEALDKALVTAGFARLQARLEPEDSSPDPGAFSEIERERAEFLKEKGIEEGYDQPRYACRACQDTGRIAGEWCLCRRQIIQKILPAYLPDRMSDQAVFANFNLNLFDNTPSGAKDGRTAREAMAQNLHMAQLYTSHFDRVRDRNLFFSGPPGTGKTFLMQCLGHKLMDEDRPVIYITAPNLFDLITRYKRQQASFRPDPDLLEEAEMLYKALHSWDLLLLDDLGTEPATQDTYAQFIMLLDSRQNRGLATVIASNLSTADFPKQYDRRVASRLRGNFLIYEFPGRDLRLREKHGL